ALSFNAYVNDIFIENGSELSCGIDTGAQIETNAFISTRHIIESVKLTIAFADGTPVFTDSAAPGIHGTFELGSSGISEHLKSIPIQEGVYTCTLDIEASAAIPGCESVTINQRNVSILAVGTGGSCISYNANSGQDAPLGECFFGSTIIPQAVPSKTGYVFSGWNTMPDGTGTTYNPGDEVLSDDSLTLYAVWNAGISSWNASVEAAYDSSLRLSGSIENPAGILTIKLAILADGVSTYENVFPCDSNTVDASAFTSKQPIELAPGEYVVELYGMSSYTSEELIFSQNLSVSSSHQTEPVQTAETLSPQSTQESGESGFSLGSIPIWVWFVLGMAVVAGLICAIVIIIKRG
ncbi:MAG: InlB B-repeat-containing protein, partial [Clostridia bacterium]|nr:InlB B-repeat-containing protein [Clostridia bacterium]